MTRRPSPARRAAVVAAALGLLSGLLLALAPSASATGALQQAASQLSAQSPLFIASDAQEVLGGDETTLRGQLSQTGTPVFVAVVSAATISAAGDGAAAAQQVARGAGSDGTYLVASPRGLWGVSNTLDPSQVREIVRGAANSASAAGPALLQAVEELGSLDTGDGSQGSGSGSGVSDGSGALTSVLLVGLVAGGGALLVQRSRTRKRQVVQDQESMAQVRTVADEDVTRFGEDIARLDLDVDSPRVDDATRGDYAAALDSYEAAKLALDRARQPEDLGAVSTALEDGRYRMECVRARVAGRPVPERRPPCFFNPQHGSSVQDVDWAPPGGQVRPVPACAPDANRVMHGEDPDARQVLVDGQQRPYWDAGPAYGGWAGGYFGGQQQGAGMGMGMGGMLPGILIGTMLGGSMGGFGGGGIGGGSFGGYDGDSGGGDFGGGGGGWGGGGGDFGGGGGDFGGGGGGFGGGDN